MNQTAPANPVPELKRYQQQCRWPDGRIQAGYEDWFTDDAAAAAATRADLTLQGYQVTAVTVENQTVTADLAKICAPKNQEQLP